MLARSGHLHLPTFVVLISMLGGVAAIGATGALLGPLVVRLCVEALAIAAERKRTALAPASDTAKLEDDAPRTPDRPASGIVGAEAGSTA